MMKIVSNPSQPDAYPALKQAADRMEAQFLSEMLKFSGMDAARGAFGGGEGEDQFASFLRQAQAEQIVAAGGIGLSESIFQSLVARMETEE